ERRERDPVPRVRDREAPDRGNVEEVEGRGAEQGGEQTQTQPPEDRRHDHREQVDDAQRDGRRDRLQRIDRERAEGDRGDRDDDTEGARARRLAQQERGAMLHLTRIMARLITRGWGDGARRAYIRVCASWLDASQGTNHSRACTGSARSSRPPTATWAARST